MKSLPAISRFSVDFMSDVKETLSPSLEAERPTQTPH
jgi:hypothetical protein